MITSTNTATTDHAMKELSIHAVINYLALGGGGGGGGGGGSGGGHMPPPHRADAYGHEACTLSLLYKLLMGGGGATRLPRLLGRV